MHTLLCQSQLETKRQHALEQEAENLRKRLKLVEAKLAQQKLKTTRILPSISETRKLIIADRAVSSRIASNCVYIGHNVQGEEYK